MSIKISIDKPELKVGGTLVHSATSWQLSRIPDFTDRTYFVMESLDDAVNLLEYRHAIDIENNEAIYARVKYHFNNGQASGWSRVIPIKGDQIGIKMSGNVVTTPKVVANLEYNGTALSVIKLTTSEMTMYSGVGAHESTTWQIVDINNKIIWERKHEMRDKLAIEVNSDILELDRVYVIKAIHHTNTNADSNTGKALLSTNVTKNSIFSLDVSGDIVPNRWLYFKLFLYTNNFKSVDIVIRDAYGMDIVVAADQVTRTPKLFTGGLIPYQRYNIMARIKYTNDSYSTYHEVGSYIVNDNLLVHKSDTATYLDDYNFTQEIQLKGMVVQSSSEIYTNDILVSKHNDDKLYLQKMCTGRLVDKGPALTLDGFQELMDKPYINIVPLYSGRILIDYNAIRVVDIDSDVVPQNVRDYMISMGLTTYEYAGLTIMDVEDSDMEQVLRHRPRFSLYDYNTVTGVFDLINSVIRDDELYGTSVSNSLVVMDVNTAYYIPTHRVADALSDTLLDTQLKKLDLNTLEVTVVGNLPVSIKSFPTLFKTGSKSFMLAGGAGLPTIIDNMDTWERSNNDLYEYSTYTNTWTNVGTLSIDIPTTMYALAAYTRRDSKVVLFNNSDSGLSLGDQRTVLYDPLDKSTIVNTNDTIDGMVYRNTIQLLNGDMLRISTRATDPQLVYTYVSDTYTIDQLNTNDVIDLVKDLVVPVGQTIMVESLYRFDTITIEGDSDLNTGRLQYLEDGKVVEFKWDDLIVTTDLVLTQDLYLGTLDEYNSITILDGAVLTVYNVIYVPDGASFTIDSPITVTDIVVGEGGELIIN